MKGLARNLVRGSRTGALISGALLVCALPAAAEEPLSAIDWLSQSVAAPAHGAAPAKVETGIAVPQKPDPSEPPVAATGALPESVAVSVLDGPSLDGVGLLSPETTGFPRNLWGLAKASEAVSAIAATGTDGLPALQGLLVTVLLAEAEPPADAGDAGALLIARIDKLLEIGALDQAEALLEAAGPAPNAELFRRSFDVALLTGMEDRACAEMSGAPELAPTLITRVFCLARAGDWNAAALTLRTAQALGHVTGTEEELLSRFLDPDLYEGEEVPEPPKPVTPLIWRLYDAIGEPLPTATLPLAFAHAELSNRAGWKAQVEAAERLARAGAITPNLLLGLYTQRSPAASGGVWDRVDAFQRFDSALTSGELSAVEQRLPLAYARMTDVEIEVPFSELFAEKLSKLPLTGDAARIAYEMGLLSTDFESLSKSPLAGDDERQLFLAGVAQGDVTGLRAPDSMARAIAPAFQAAPPAVSEEAQALLDQHRIGEAILLAISQVQTGLHGELTKVTTGLVLLRHLGLEEPARRVALELMLLERRG